MGVPIPIHSAAKETVMGMFRRSRTVTAVVAAWILTCRAGGAVEPPPAELPPGRPAAPERLDTPARALGYALGMRIGSRIAADFKGQQDPPVDAGALAQGLADAVLEARPRLTEAQFREVLEAFDAKMLERERQFAARMEQAAKVNRAKADEFAKANAERRGVVTRPSGLQYEVIRAGSGASPKPDDTVAAHYKGTHLDGREFDATDPRGDPALFPLRAVVPGWQEALSLMKTGARWKVFVPPQLGYGEEGSPPVIEPNEMLIFEIELVRVVPATK